ncbi:rCG44642 [Rattus norvegicus]|uniref:RCG44642 n=1 Tax=Rattus norvegicus TaxID=10116 RepID=A6I518_RAT|nr:rCG44642 [Rattus norvegicus]
MSVCLSTRCVPVPEKEGCQIPADWSYRYL